MRPDSSHIDVNVNSPAQSAGLSALLQRHLPGARAELARLDGGPALYLLNADFPQHELSAEQMQAVLNYPAYWAFCWASGGVMAQLLQQRPHWVAGKRVLDFGAGSGVAGIAAALAGAREVLACDLDADARQAVRENAALNGVAITVLEDIADCAGELDLVLAADVLYDRENLPWVDRLLELAPAVLLADSRIRDFSHPRYRKLGQWQGTTVPDLDEFDEFRRVSIYRGAA